MGEPWTADHFTRVLGANAVASLLIGASWYQVSGAGTVRSQLAWLNLGIAGLVVGGVANGLWILRGRRAVGVAMAALSWPAGHADRRQPEASLGPSRNQLALVAPAGTPLYHRPDCPLARGRTVDTGTRSDHEKAGRRRCEVCEP